MDKLERLIESLSKHNKLCIAFSGGVDSSFLLKAAKMAFADNVTAIMADAAVVPRHEISEAKSLAGSIGVPLNIISVDALSVPELRNNDKMRCYYCKKNIFGAIKNKASELGFSVIADGKNADDSKFYRPGAQAAIELSVISPLAELDFTKDEIRAFSKQLGLPTWQKPAYACLATRLPYNTEITLEKLSLIETAEAVLHKRGYKNIRVRMHGDIARIESPKEFFQDIISDGQALSELHEIGFKYVTLDLDGFRSGSMD